MEMDASTRQGRYQRYLLYHGAQQLNQNDWLTTKERANLGSTNRDMRDAIMSSGDCASKMWSKSMGGEATKCPFRPAMSTQNCFQYCMMHWTKWLSKFVMFNDDNRIRKVYVETDCTSDGRVKAYRLNSGFLNPEYPTFDPNFIPNMFREISQYVPSNGCELMLVVK